MAGLAALLAVLAVTLPATAQPAPSRLFGTVGYNQTPSTLVELDPLTGDLLQTIGPVGYTVNGLAYDQTAGTLYASTAVGDPNYNGLITIDLATGAGTPVGVHGWGVSDPASPTPVTNLAADSSGRLFAWWEAWDDLVSVDPVTGVATWVGDSDLSTWENGLAFDATDVLYLVNGSWGNCYTVDTSSGAATYVGTLGIRAHHGDFDPAGFYYGIDATGSYGSARNLVVAEPSTGTVIALLPTVDNLHVVEFVGAGGSVPRGPDLVVPILTHNSPTVVTRYLSVGQAYVRCQQANQGTLASRPCVLRFWLSSDPFLDPGDRLLALRAVRSLSPGQKTAITSTLLRLGRRLLPWEPAYIIAEVDADDQVGESREFNNTAVLRLQDGGYGDDDDTGPGDDGPGDDGPY